MLLTPAFARPVATRRTRLLPGHRLGRSPRASTRHTANLRQVARREAHAIVILGRRHDRLLAEQYVPVLLQDEAVDLGANQPAGVASVE
eukprot:2519806-Prymnesium_polylepis.1